MRMTVTLVAVAMALTASVARADDSTDSTAPRIITESDGFTCPVPDILATPQQVIATRIADLAAGDINGVMCTYAVGATVVMAGSVIKGRPAIESSFVAFFGLLGNTIPTFTSQTYSGPIALVTYTVSTPAVTVPDGADTFVIAFGRIQYHTVSASLQFH